MVPSLSLSRLVRWVGGVAAMRVGGLKSSVSRRPTVLLLISTALVFSVLIFSIQSTFFSDRRTNGNVGSGTLESRVVADDGSGEDESISVQSEDIQILSDFQSQVQQCVVFFILSVLIFFGSTFGSAPCGVRCSYGPCITFPCFSIFLDL